MNTIKLPVCRRYLTGDLKPDILYTLAISSNKISSSVDSATALHALMVSEGIIDQGHPLPKVAEGISCFQIVSEHKCGYICHMCPYAKKNKNQNEMQEAVILSFILKNYDNLKLVQDAGLQPEHFSALFLLNDLPSGKIVPTIPLIKLAYQYMAHKVANTTIFSELPEKITEALDAANKGKLLPQNLQTIRSFLAKLQSGYKTLTSEKVLELSQSLINTGKEDTGKKEECLSGLLDNRQIKAQPIPKDLSSEPDTPAVEDVPYLPLVFSIKELENTGFSFTILPDMNSDYRLLEAFLQFNPLFGAEIVTDKDTNQEMLLLCASDQFFYLEQDDEEILSLLAGFLSKSRARKQICMEPFRLYHFLSKNHLCYDNVFSLRGAYKLLSEERGNPYKGITPGKLTKELLSRDNQHHYSPYVFVMPYYVKMYETLSGHPLLQSKEAKFRLRRQTAIDALMGISYDYRLPSGERRTAFTLDECRVPAFSYQDGQRLGGGFYCVTFTFSSEKPLGGLVSNILYRIVSRHLSETHGYRLLKFSKNSFTVSTAADEYEHLCDLVANLATYLSEQEQLIPLFIKEDCLR